jgi:UDP-glucuronate 4-epimerase
MYKTILITGCCGFIGYHTTLKLLQKKNVKVIGLDNINNHYDVKIKKDRLKILKKNNLKFYKIDIKNFVKLKKIFLTHKPNYVINLAAQAGVRKSIKNPKLYLDANIIGFYNILELCGKYKIKHLLYASSSSVYGLNNSYAFKEIDETDHPISFYAATKKCNEVLAHYYSYKDKLPTTGLRFFTVYGPYGRPDMSMFIFVKNILNNKKIDVFNYGKMSRDFTYVEDVATSIIKLIPKIPRENKKFLLKSSKSYKSKFPFRILNVGNSKQVSLLKYIKLIEKKLLKKCRINFKKIQLGDVKKTLSNSTELYKIISYKPKTKIETGISKFIEWYKNYYKIK